MSEQTAYLAGGCFWCLDAVFSHVKGVTSVRCGYAGGTVKNPTYEEVCSETTGHAETVKIVFDPEKISYEDLLHVFFSVHDPTTLNRQGNDVGTQYRSVIFYDGEGQKASAQKIMRELVEEKIYSDEIVTELVPLDTFYEAEEYHQKYFDKNPDKAYCQTVIVPKVAKLRQKYAALYV